MSTTPTRTMASVAFGIQAQFEKYLKIQTIAGNQSKSHDSHVFVPKLRIAMFKFPAKNLTPHRRWFPVKKINKKSHPAFHMVYCIIVGNKLCAPGCRFFHFCTMCVAEFFRGTLLKKQSLIISVLILPVARASK